MKLQEKVNNVKAHITFACLVLGSACAVRCPLQKSDNDRMKTEEKPKKIIFNIFPTRKRRRQNEWFRLKTPKTHALQNTL